VLKGFIDENQGAFAEDHDGDPVFLARNAWHLDRIQEDYPKVRFSAIKETTS
jgi:peptide chain release factor 3